MMVARRPHLAGAGRAHDEYAEFAHDEGCVRRAYRLSQTTRRGCDARCLNSRYRSGFTKVYRIPQEALLTLVSRQRRKNARALESNFYQEVFGSSAIWCSCGFNGQRKYGKFSHDRPRKEGGKSIVTLGIHYQIGGRERAMYVERPI